MTIFDKIKQIKIKIDSYYNNQEVSSKEEIIKLFENELNISKIKRSLYADFESENPIIYRFLWTKFDEWIPSNTYLSIKNIYIYDEMPILVVLVRPNWYNISLWNTSFVNKVSHSSKGSLLNEETGEFTLLGSVNYSNLFIDSDIEKLDDLWNFHIENDKNENIKRILKKTSEISWYGYEPVHLDEYSIQTFIQKTTKIHNDVYDELLEHISNAFSHNAIEIWKIFNEEPSPKRRWEKIQSLITWMEDNDHEFADVYYELWDKSILINIKTIDLTLASFNSSPQAFSIDKLLNNIDSDDSFAFYFFIITKTEKWIFFNLVNFLEDDAINSYWNPMKHWSWEHAKWHMQISWIANLLKNKQNKKEIIFEKEALEYLTYLNNIDND